MKRSYKYIFWDWNGTLVNDVYAALESVNDILDRRNRPRIDLQRYYELVATPITIFYERLFAPEKPDFTVLAEEFHTGYDRHMQKYGLMPGVKDILTELNKLGAVQIVISSSERNRLKEQVARFGISDIFAEIIGQDGFRCASKLESAKEYMQTAGISPSDAVLIGDLDHDFEVASALGCDCLLISKGHQSHRALSAFGVMVLKDVSELFEYINIQK